MVSIKLFQRHTYLVKLHAHLGVISIKKSFREKKEGWFPMMCLRSHDFGPQCCMCNRLRRNWWGLSLFITPTKAAWALGWTATAPDMLMLNTAPGTLCRGRKWWSFLEPSPSHSQSWSYPCVYKDILANTHTHTLQDLHCTPPLPCTQYFSVNEGLEEWESPFFSFFMSIKNKHAEKLPFSLFIKPQTTWGPCQLGVDESNQHDL